MKKEKYTIDTPQDQLVAQEKKLKRSFGWFLGFGIFFFVGAVYPFAIFLLCVAAYAHIQKRKIGGLIAEQNRLAEQARMDQELQRKILADQRWEEAQAAQAKFLETNELVRTFYTKVAGVTFRNNDGSSRQENLSYCISGGDVTFEHYTYKGEPAYAVYCGGLQIGNLPADIARDLYDLPDTYTFFGEISEVTGGEDGLKYGCNLQIELYREK